MRIATVEKLELFLELFLLHESYRYNSLQTFTDCCIKESNFITTNKRITFLAEAVPFASQKQNGGSKLNKKENRKKTPEKQIKNIEKKKNRKKRKTDTV